MGAIIYGATQGKEAIQDGIHLNVVLYVIAILVMFFFAVKSYISASKNPLFLDNLDKEFRKNYVCPNPDCHRFLGFIPYEDVVKMKACGLCKSKYKNE